MRGNNWISLFIAGGLLLTLTSGVGAWAAAPIPPSAMGVPSVLPSTVLRAGLSTSSAIPDMARRPPSSSLHWGENRLTSLPLGGIEGGLFAKTGIAGTSFTSPDRLKDDTGPVNGPNALDPKRAIDDFVADADQPVGADEIVSFLTDQAKPALQAGSFGPAAVFNPAATGCIAAVKLTDSKFVVAYTDMGNSSYGAAIVGQVSGTVISYGSETVFNAAGTEYVSVAALSDSKFVVAYQVRAISSWWYGTAIVGQVSGTSISYGPASVFNSANTHFQSVTALSDSKFVVAYMDGGNADSGTAMVGQVSGTTINYGPPSVFNAAVTVVGSVAVLSDTKFVVAYQDVGNSGYGTAIVGQVSGTTISYGSESVFNAADTWDVSVATLTDSKFVVAYSDWGNLCYGTAIVGQVSGTTISYGSETVFNPAVTDLYPGGVARLSGTTFVVGFSNNSDGDGRVIAGTVSGNTISFGNQVSYNTGSSSFEVTVVGLSPSKYVVAWDDESNGDYGTAKVSTIPTFGPAAVFNPAATFNHIAAAKLTDSKFVVAYTDVGNSYYGTAIVGQVSGTTITWGNEYVFNAAGTSFVSVAALSNSKFVVAYCDWGNSDYGTAIVGQVSDTAITWGNESVFNAAVTVFESVAALSDSKFVVAYQDVGNSDYGTAIVGQVSGTAISYGSETVFNWQTTVGVSVAALSDSKFVVAYTDLGYNYGTARVGQVSGTAISYGPASNFNWATADGVSVAALSDSEFVVAYCDWGNSSYGTAIVGQVSDTAIGYGSETVFNAAPTRLYHSGGVTRLSATAFAVGYENESDDDGRVIVGTVSGNAITFGHWVSYNAGSDSYDVTVVGLSPKFVVAWDDESNGDYGTAKVGMISTNGQGVYLPIILKNH